jgi:hypothetical protein
MLRHKEYEMASKQPIPQSDPNYMSPEECQELFGSFLAADPESMQIRIPDWQVELLKERMADYCENGVHGIPLEEIEEELLEEHEKELLEELMKR